MAIAVLTDPSSYIWQPKFSTFWDVSSLASSCFPAQPESSNAAHRSNAIHVFRCFIPYHPFITCSQNTAQKKPDFRPTKKTYAKETPPKMATATFCRMIPVRRKCILKNKQVSWLKLRPQRLPKKSVASCCILAITVTGSSRNHTGFPFHRANARTYFQRPKGRLCELFIIIA